MSCQSQTYTEQELAKFRRNLPQAITIMQSPATGHYIWQWMTSRGEAETFLQAVENALIAIQVSWTEE